MRGQRFGGESAQLLWRSLHPEGLFAGLLAGGLCAAIFLLFGRSPQLSRGIGLAWAAVAFAIVTRVALDARNSGEMGSFLRGRGADSRALLAALGRVLLLNLCWIVPAAMFASSKPSTSLAAPAVPAAVGLVAPLALLLPPTLLVIALGANAWPELFQAAHWRRLLQGRLADLSQLYASYLGATFAMALLIWSSVLGLASSRPKLLLILSVLALSYQIGVALLLLGRLIGAFLRVADEDAVAAAASAPLPSPEAPPVEHSVGPAPAAMAASSELAPRQSAELKEDERGDSLVVRLRQLERVAEMDPGQALAELESLRQERGPHPLLLARLAVLQHGLELPSANQLAREAVELARRSGNVGVLAELELAFGEQASSIGIQESDWLRIAASHLLKGREDEAAELYARSLQANAESTAALKGLLKIAEARERNDRDLDGAMNLHATVLRLAPDHEFAEFAERKMAALERRLLRSV